LQSARGGLTQELLPFYYETAANQQQLMLFFKISSNQLKVSL